VDAAGWWLKRTSRLTTRDDDPKRARLVLARALTALLPAFAAGAHAAPPVTTAGPFAIETLEKSVSAGGFPNTSGNPFKRTRITVFRLKHRGKVVAVTDRGHSNEEFWEARILEGAPRPAILLASVGVYLVTEESNQPRVQILVPSSSGGATWQWLDGDGGQPGPEQGAGIRHAGEEPRGERGGTLLLVSRQVLLDVPKLAVKPMSAYTTENVNRAERFNASNQPARALSPGRGQHVLVGQNDRNEHGLVVMRHDTGEAYAVRFDRDKLRYESVHDATPDWIARNFEWRNEAGGEKLALRKDLKPPPWVGRFVNFGGGMIEYRLVPTGEAMLAPLHEFVTREFGAVPNPAPRLAEGTDSKAILVEGKPLRISRNAKERYTTLYAESAGAAKPAYDLVDRIGRRFNEELARGRHQEHFTAFKE
jgi:hypothetical protein